MDILTSNSMVEDIEEWRMTNCPGQINFDIKAFSMFSYVS